MGTKARMIMASCGLALALAWSVPARAGACPADSGFTDVLMGATYCTNAQWLRNRGITLGCGDGPAFCPDAAVTRAQMALFLNRMAIALGPLWVEANDNGTVSTATDLTGCHTVTLPVATYPRAATLDGFVTVSAPSAAMVVAAQGVGVINGSTVTDGPKAQASLATTGTVVLPVSALVAVNAGASATFYVQMSQAGAPLPATFTRNCHLIVRIDNYNSPVPPY